MCGIAGFVSRHPAAGGEPVLRRMTDSIRHRGPDADGYFVDAHAALGHRRLSIIDLSKAGQQPMTSESGQRIVYNGEVFNHAALRLELERAGHLYRSHCDTETLLHAYEEYGPVSVSKLRGMFAFALWDPSTRTLFGARDRLGIKPFHYYFDGQVFVFASEIKALLEHPAISPALNEAILPEYLAFGFGSSDQTLFRGIRKLMPGHWFRLEVTDAGLNLDIQPYWDVPEPEHPAIERRSEAEWTRDLRAHLEEAVETRLMSDVPLGAFLSGGVDSSAITALMRRHSRGPVQTFAVGYREAAYSELGYARQVADHLGTEHHEVLVGHDDFFDALPKLIWHEDEPITWPSSVSLYYISRKAAETVKVVLTGEGSDELFGGYERYGHYLMNRRWMDCWRTVPGPLRRLVQSQVASSPLLAADLRRKLGHTFLGREDSVESLHLDNFYCALSAGEQRSLLPGLQGETPYAPYRHFWNARGGASPLTQMLYADQKTYLVELLKKQDRMSMAASIESRVPLLDHHLVEFSTAIPDHLKIHRGESKYIFKRAVEDLLPREIVYRKKMGFPTPLRQWLREEKASQVFALLQNKDGLLAPYLDRASLAQLLSRQASGAEDATDRIWRLLNLQIWGDLFVTGKRQPLGEGAAVS